MKTTTHNRVARCCLLAILVLFLVMLAAIVPGCRNPQDDTIVMGAIVPLTGDSAFWGKNLQNGIALAVEEINQGGGILHKKLVIQYEDTQAQPAVGVRAVSKLIATHHVQCIVGDTISSVMLAVAPIVERNKCVLLGFGESAEITKAGDYIFRNWNSAASDAEITAQFASTNSHAIAVFSQNDAFGRSAKELFVSEVRKKNVRIVTDDVFTKGETDFRTLLTKLTSVDYDGLYVACFHQDAIVFLRQYKELGLKPTTFYGVSSWEEGNFVSFLAQNYPGLVYFGYPRPPDLSNPAVSQFKKKYIAKYGKQPEILCDNGYDAVLMLKYAIEKCGKYQGPAIKDALYTLKDFQGASGVMTFDQNGDVHKPFGLKTVTKAGLAWVE